MIKVLHNVEDVKSKSHPQLPPDQSPSMKKKWWTLGATFTVSAVYVLLSYFIPVLKNIPFMDAFGAPEATAFYWILTPCMQFRVSEFLFSSLPANDFVKL